MLWDHQKETCADIKSVTTTPSLVFSRLSVHAVNYRADIDI